MYVCVSMSVQTSLNRCKHGAQVHVRLHTYMPMCKPTLHCVCVIFDSRELC